MTISCMDVPSIGVGRRSPWYVRGHTRRRGAGLSHRVSIFLCDDVPELRALLRFGLQEDPALEVIGEAGHARAAIDAVGELQPAVVLLDISMPGMDGFEAIPELLAVAPRTAIIVFSAYAGERMRETALALGAVRYVEKGTSLEQLRATVREVAGLTA